MAMLYVVATPIGNLQDITFRALEVLRSAAVIIAEDTRVTAKLLNHYGIRGKLISCNAHTERQKAQTILQKLISESLDAALVTDAGTPGISDPGSFFVQCAVAAGVPVVPVPGACAAACAVSISGIETRQFAFLGFPPREDKELRLFLQHASETQEVIVLHESPHRIAHLLDMMRTLLPGCIVSLSCDLTKLHELTLRGAVEDVYRQVIHNPNAEKGEYILVADLRPVQRAEKEEQPLSIEARLLNHMLQGYSLREAMEKVVAEGERKNAVYQASLRLKTLLK